MTLSQALRHAPTTVGNFWPKVPASNAVSSACAASALTAVFQAMDCQLLQRGYIARCGQHRMRHTVFLPTAYWHSLSPQNLIACVKVCNPLSTNIASHSAQLAPDLIAACVSTT